MIEKKLICDICGKEIDATFQRYELRGKWNRLKFGKYDICYDCMDKIKQSIKQAKSK